MIIARFAVLIAVLLSGLALGDAATVGQCGPQPEPPPTPIECRSLNAVCVCDARGDCHWEWQCVRERTHIRR
jgi:hypothetical protein